MAVRRLDDILAETYRELVPRLNKEFAELAGSSVQVGTWLVGLAAGVIALVLTEGADSVVPPLAAKTGIALLLVVITCGVIQRILFHLADRLRWPLFLRMQGALIGYTDPSDLAWPLAESWDVPAIVARLKKDFEVDVEWFLEFNVSLDRARAIYQDFYDLHKEHERKGLATLAKIIAVHTGMTEEAERRFFEPNPDDASRKKARSVNRIFIAAELLYFAAAISFISAILVLGIGAVRWM